MSTTVQIVIHPRWGPRRWGAPNSWGALMRVEAGSTAGISPTPGGIVYAEAAPSSDVYGEGGPSTDVYAEVI